jgi:hypothetical protein
MEYLHYSGDFEIRKTPCLVEALAGRTVFQIAAGDLIGLSFILSTCVASVLQSLLLLLLLIYSSPLYIAPGYQADSIISHGTTAALSSSTFIDGLPVRCASCHTTARRANYYSCRFCSERTIYETPAQSFCEDCVRNRIPPPHSFHPLEFCTAGHVCKGSPPHGVGVPGGSLLKCTGLVISAALLSDGRLLFWGNGVASPQPVPLLFGCFSALTDSIPQIASWLMYLQAVIHAEGPIRMRNVTCGYLGVLAIDQQGRLFFGKPRFSSLPVLRPFQPPSLPRQLYIRAAIAAHHVLLLSNAGEVFLLDFAHDPPVAQKVRKDAFKQASFSLFFFIGLYCA